MMRAYIILIIGLVGTYCILGQYDDQKMNQKKKVNVWDTYITKKNGAMMHFDILVPVSIVDTTIVYQYGREYLVTKGQEGQQLTSKQCRLCHVETLRPSWEKDIQDKGYSIIEMEGCE